MKIVNTLDISYVPEAKIALEEAGNLINIKPDRKLVLSEIADADAYMVSCKVMVDKEFLNIAKRLKVIGSPHTGTDHLDIPHILDKGIELFTISEEYDLLKSFTATSELTFALLLSLIRKLPVALNSTKRGDWAREKFSGFQLLGKTMGILGLGRLGKITARIALGFGMNVIAYDTDDINMRGVKMVNFNELFKHADVLSIHIHLTDLTNKLIGVNEFKMMKDDAILLNTSRGAIIDEVSLLEALENKIIGGAGLDVIDGEWLDQDDLIKHPLINYSRSNSNLLISPHIGGSTKESIYGARIFMANKIKNYLIS